MDDIVETLKEEIRGDNVPDNAPCITKVRNLRLAIECIEALCRRIKYLEER